MSRKQKILWRALATVAGIVTTLAVSKSMSAAWQRSTGKPVPDNPYDRRTSWGEAVAWAAALGVTVSVARVVANRMSSAAWERATGNPPPGVAA